MKKNKSQEVDLLYLNNKTTKKGEKTKRPSKTKAKKDKSEENDIFKFDEEIVIGMTKPKQDTKKPTKKKTKATKKVSKQKNKPNSPQTKKQEKKPKSKALSITKWITLILLLIGASIYFLMCPLFNIQEIQVIGNEKISTNEIISLAQINNNENIFKAYLGETKENIKQNPYIDSVDLKMVLPNILQVEVKERKTTFLLEFANAYAYINNQGYILEISEEKLELPIIIGYQTQLEDIKAGNRLCQEDLYKLETVLKIAETANSYEIKDTITKIDITNKDEYILLLEEEKKTVYLGDASNIHTKMLYLKEIISLEKDKEMLVYLNVDLNTEKVYTREKV